MRLASGELVVVRLPLVRPFRTSFTTQEHREAVLVHLVADDGADGWGECVASYHPFYSDEFTATVLAVGEQFLWPILRDAGQITAAHVHELLTPVRGHRMAKAAFELAVLDASLRTTGTSLADHLGGVRKRVDVGVSVGITDTIDQLLDVVGGYLDDGYQRIKLKIEPGFDVEPVRAVRDRFGPEVLLQVDANAGYEMGDWRTLAALDEHDLLLVEQPFPEDDLGSHAALAERIETPVCLDESITSAARALEAIEMGACSIVNIKAGRVGGFLEARRIHDVCRAARVPVWCGGMLETGIGRAANLALASLPGFTLPGDISASSRYFATDLTDPFELDGSTLAVPTGPGIGVTPDLDRLAACTVSTAPLAD